MLGHRKLTPASTIYTMYTWVKIDIVEQSFLSKQTTQQWQALNLHLQI